MISCVVVSPLCSWTDLQSPTAVELWCRCLLLSLTELSWRRPWIRNYRNCTVSMQPYLAHNHLFPQFAAVLHRMTPPTPPLSDCENTHTAACTHRVFFLWHKSLHRVIWGCLVLCCRICALPAELPWWLSRKGSFSNRRAGASQPSCPTGVIFLYICPSRCISRFYAGHAVP